MSSPSDPSVTCFENDEEGIFDGCWKRASAQAHFAAENGVKFADVRCLRAYGRPFTRQQVWEREGRQRWADEKNMANKVGWYFERWKWHDPSGGSAVYRHQPLNITAANAPVIRTTHLPEGFYLDCDGETPAKGYEEADAPKVVPDDWEPSEDMHCWMFCDRHHPDAVPLWACEC